MKFVNAVKRDFWFNILSEPYLQNLPSSSRAHLATSLSVVSGGALPPARLIRTDNELRFAGRMDGRRVDRATARKYATARVASLRFCILHKDTNPILDMPFQLFSSSVTYWIFGGSNAIHVTHLGNIKCTMHKILKENFGTLDQFDEFPNKINYL